MMLAVSAGAVTPATAGDGSITLIHMGDVHGHLVPRPNVRSDSSGYPEGGLAHMYTKIKSIRDAAVKKKIPTLLFNTGDTIQGSAEAMFTRGQAMVDVLNSFGIVGYTPGNWDFLYGKDRFTQLFVGDPTLGVAPTAPWGLVAANLYYTGTTEVPGAVCPSASGKRVAPAYRILNAGNVKVGVLGMTTERGIPAIGLKATTGFTFTSGEAAVTNANGLPDKELPCFINHLRNVEQVDLIAMLSELELGKTIPMTETYPGVDVVLNADMHEETAKAIVSGSGTLLVEEGQDGTALGELKLTIVGKKITSYTWVQHVINTRIAADKTVAAKIVTVRKPFTSGPGYVPNQTVTIGGNTAKLLRPIDTVVGTAGINLHRSNFSHESPPAAVEGSSHNLMADAFKWAAGSDIATVRGFRYGTHVPAGKPIKMEDLYHYMPIAARIAKAGPVTAAQLVDQVENSTRSVFDTNARNWRGGWMFAYSGVNFSLDPYQPWGCRGSDIKVNGVSIAPNPAEPTANLSGVVNAEQQVPKNASKATATISGSYDKASKAATLTVTVTGLSPSQLTGAHIHLGGCGASGGVVYSIGTAGWTTTSTGMKITFTAPIPAANEADFLAGKTYVNLHSATYTGGEIRGQVIATTTKGFYVAGYWYADDPNTINNCGNCTIVGGSITPLVDSSGNPIDTTEIVVNYLASLPNKYANPSLYRINLLKALPAPQYGFSVIQPLQGAK
mgnify:CR=1 FL=1